VSDDSENFMYITYVIYFVMDPNKKIIKDIFMVYSLQRILVLPHLQSKQVNFQCAQQTHIFIAVYQHILMRLSNAYISVAKDPYNASIGNT
jgi:hypothetical protein